MCPVRCACCQGMMLLEVYSQCFPTALKAKFWPAGCNDRLLKDRQTVSKTTLSGVERGDYTACITAPHIGHCDIITNGKTHVGKSADGLMSSPEAAKGPLDATLLCHNDIYGGFSCTNGYLVKGECLPAFCLSLQQWQLQCRSCAA